MSNVAAETPRRRPPAERIRDIQQVLMKRTCFLADQGLEWPGLICSQSRRQVQHGGRPDSRECHTDHSAAKRCLGIDWGIADTREPDIRKWYALLRRTAQHHVLRGPDVDQQKTGRPRQNPVPRISDFAFSIPKVRDDSAQCFVHVQ